MDAAAETMEKIKKQRTQTRRQFTTLLNAIKGDLKKETPDLEEILGKFDSLTARKLSLEDADQAILDSMYDEKKPETEVNAELDTAATYETDYNVVKRRIAALEYKLTVPPRSESPSIKNCALKLPKISLRTFSGELSDWLPFWSQFQGVHDREDLPNTAKFSYLLSVLKPGTACKMVSGYQVTEENYEKAVKALQERFGNKDVLLHVHIRELLKLFIRNIEAKKKMGLVEFHDELETHLNSLEALQFNQANPATILFPLVESCLPKDILMAWQRSSESEAEDPNKSKLDILRGFVKKEVRRQLNVEIAEKGFYNETFDNVVKPSFQKKVKNPRSSRMEDVPTLAGLKIGDVSCIFCGKDNHESKECRKAALWSRPEKEAAVKKSNVCFQCLKPGHFKGKCNVKVKCKTCGQASHWAVMCRAKSPEKSPEPRVDDNEPRPGPSNQPDPPRTLSGCTNQVCTDQVLLQTLIVKVGWEGKFKNARLFMDPGSQRSYIRTELAEELNLPVMSQEANRHSLFGGTQTRITHHKTYNVLIFNLDGVRNTKVFLKSQDVICGAIPRLREGNPIVKELRSKGIQLSDVGQGVPTIDNLIGSDYYLRLVEDKKVHVGYGLTAIETHLGWTLAGETRKRELGDSIAMTLLSMNQTEDDVKKLWELDAIGIKDPREAEDVEKKEVVAAYQSTIGRKLDGRYVVTLPWKEGHPPLPENRLIAEKRLEATTRKLKKNGAFAAYNQVFLDWEKEGFIERVSVSKRCHFIPHRPVFKDSPTTPVRPVFDASCKVGHHPSLNECLETGPNFVKSIPELLVRFREKQFGVISDIRKAFQMIEVVEEDRDLCRFLWWNVDGSLLEYRHARVMFGATCSPFILGAVIDHHLNSVSDADKSVAEQLRESMYVDNCVTSVDSMEEYDSLRVKSIEIMARAQMDLRLWMSNGDFLEDDEVVPVLGLQWDRNFDQLFVDVKNVVVPEKVTKRVVLSTLAEIFDVIGFLSPALLPIKMILQQSWILELKWDEELPRNEKIKFLKFFEELPLLKKIRVPRLVSAGVVDRDKWSLHLFTDASQDAYAAVVFLRVQCWSHVMVQLLAAKSRVAPAPTKKKKRMTIPRLELMGAVIGARLLDMVKKALKIHNVVTYCWSDSTTAIAWIKRERPRVTFVGNRVKEVRVVTPPEMWRHVPGEINIADLPSRGCSIQELKASRWWEGPDWLKDPEEDWHSFQAEINENVVNEELKKTAPSELVMVNSESLTRRDLTFSQTVNMLGWIIRIQRNSRKSPAERILSHRLSQEEVEDARRQVIKMMQCEGVPEVTGKKPTLATVKAADGILCVKTRLSYRDDLAGFKFPMLLPTHHELTKKLISEEHVKNHHAGVNFLMAKLREEYWIPQARKIIKNVLKKCSRCYRHKVKATAVMEAPLPLNRVKDTEVFDIVGVDLAGPFLSRGGKKMWIVLYTCAVYRALHLDVVTSLTTSSFVKSLDAFVRKYHRPSVIYSDNGTNFHGADNLFRTLDWEAIMKTEDIKPIRWIFNPPSAAWWGGWWERLVRSVKDLLKRNLGRASLNVDEFRKVLWDIQHVVNNRPLTYVSEDEEDLQPLTPQMFLNPAALLPCGFPEEELAEPEKFQRRYRYLQQLKTELRNRFRSEYLGILKQKPSKATPELKVGDIVLVGSDGHKRMDWPLGRILQLHPGRDKVERVAVVKTKDGTYIRPVQRLFRMETDDNTATELKKSLRGRPLKLPDRLKF